MLYMMFRCLGNPSSWCQLEAYNGTYKNFSLLEISLLEKTELVDITTLVILIGFFLKKKLVMHLMNLK